MLQALEKDPDKRFPSAQSLLAALEDAAPSSLESNAEARIAGFMKGLLGARGVERRKQIRLAGELLDQRPRAERHGDNGYGQQRVDERGCGCRQLEWQL